MGRIKPTIMETSTLSSDELLKKYKDYNFFIGNVVPASRSERRKSKQVDLLDTDTSLLSGYTIVVSDNINVKGFKTSAGTEALKNYKPTEDAEVIKRLREEGGTVIGKGNIHELGF